MQNALEEADNYAASLSRSLALVLEEFYQTLQHVSVSSVTGEGMSELMQVHPTCNRVSVHMLLLRSDCRCSTSCLSSSFFISEVTIGDSRRSTACLSSSALSVSSSA
jgi:hypothetical protein